MTQHSVTMQGHWWISGAWTRVRRPGLFVAEFEFEQKRPHIAYIGTGPSDKAVEFGVTSREGSLGFREGEDGSESTHIELPLPRALPWRKWEFPVIDEDKWNVRVVSFTRARRLWEFPWYVRLRRLRRG